MRAGTVTFIVVVALVALAAIGGAVALATGLVALPGATNEPQRVFVILGAPSKEGVTVAPVGFVLDANGTATVVDMTAPAQVSGTSASTVRDALPFGGGAAVARAAAPQTGDPAVPWIVLDAPLWTGMVDAAGGLPVEMPDSFHSYTGGTLVSIPQGPVKLSGAQAAALASGVEFAGDEAQRATLARQVATGLSAIVGGEGAAALRQAVETGQAQASAPLDELPLPRGAR